MAMNILLIIGSGLSLVDNMAFICVGKFLYGLSVGGFTVYAPNFINESVPIKHKGPFNSMLNAMIALGLLIPLPFGLWIPNDAVTHVDTFWIQQYWRVIWAFPILLALL